MRFKVEKERRSLMLRCWSKDYRQGEIAYAVLGLRGPRLEIEFPSDWHEYRRAWVRIGTGLLYIAFSLPWRKTVPDQGQCSGPTYGFYFFESHMVLQWGKTTGGRGDPQKFINMPWAWEHVRHSYLHPTGVVHHDAASGEYEPPPETKEAHPYIYVLRDRTIQHRTATINGEEREWRWFKWLPWPRKISRSINIEFDQEVGERTGSWKGGTTGCGYEWGRGESMVQALRRMERQREFR